MADITFLMNSDLPGDPNQFYTLAKQFFVAAASTVIDAPSPGQTLHGVLKKLTELNVAQKTINLVCHASGFASMQAPLSPVEQLTGRLTVDVIDLQNALAKKSLTAPGPAVISDKTRIVIFGCDVGRSELFLKLLSGLFGDPGEVLGPRRVGVFKLDGGAVKYRQAQTWSLVRKPPLVLGSAQAPTGGWPNYRTQFIHDADLKFGRLVLPDDPVGTDPLLAMLTNAAANATKAFGPSFFLEEGVDILSVAPQTAAQIAANLTPISNGDPVTAQPKTALQVDDTTVVTTLTSADAYPVNAADPAKSPYAITVALLAQIIEQEVLIAEGPDYRRVTASKTNVPSTGPKPVGGATGTGGGSSAGAANEIQPLIDLLLADGATQADLDALVELVPQGDATEDIVTDFPDDIEEVDDPNGLLLPTRLELA